MSEEKITFSFGENWSNFIATVDATEMELARKDLEEWLSIEQIQGKNVLDIGSGSGIHSLSFMALGAASVCSFDADKNSVSATRATWEKAGKPDNWKVEEGSVLDKTFIQSLGAFDLVYSWGVLHHTGSMWEAIENAQGMVKAGGIFFITLYAAGTGYEADLALKKKYNAASAKGKRLIEWRWIANLMFLRLRRVKNPFGWNEKSARGMNVYHDLVDWLGGLPYEVAAEDEVLVYFRKRGFVLERIKVFGEGSCNTYVFRLLENS